MKATELLSHLQALIHQHGDLEVGYYLEEYDCYLPAKDINIENRKCNKRDELNSPFIGIS